MQHQYIQDFAQYAAETNITIKGWIDKVRNSKTNHFFDFRDGTGFTQCVVSIDVVGEAAFEEAKSLTLESSVSFSGKLIPNERSLGGFELQVESFEIYHIAHNFPITKEDKEH